VVEVDLNRHSVSSQKGRNRMEEPCRELKPCPTENPERMDQNGNIVSYQSLEGRQKLPFQDLDRHAWNSQAGQLVNGAGTIG